MLKSLWSQHRILTVVVAALSIIALIALASLFIPVYGDICRENTHTGHEDCATHDIVLVVFWQIGEFLNYYGVAVTAIATGFIGVFTYTLYKTSAEQAGLTNDVLKLARDEFNATHRPKIFAQTLSITEEGEHAGTYMREDGTIPKATPCEGIITVANGGDAVAFIVEWQSLVYFQASGTAFKPALDLAKIRRPKPGASPSIPPGVIEHMKHSQIQPMGVAWSTFRQGGRHKMFFIGRIFYEGPDEIRRCTGFCREWDNTPGEGRWKSVENSEHEFAY